MPQNKQNRNAYLENPGKVRGSPGYRTRGERSGFDPLDSSAESARMEGLLYRKLFTFQLRTRNPFYLFLMFLFGVIPFVVLLYLVGNSFSYSGQFHSGMVCPSVFLLITGIVAVNFLINLLEILHVLPAGKGRASGRKR